MLNSTAAHSIKKSEREAAAKAKRRIGRVMHDERGNGYIHWEPAPENYVRDLLELVDDRKGFDPYDTTKK